MSSDSLNSAPPPSTTTEARSSAASAAALKHREQKGPAVGFEALLAVLTAAQDQTAATAQDATGKQTLQGLLVQAGADSDAAAKDASKKDAAADTTKDGAAIALDAAQAAQDAAATAPNVTPVITVAQPAPASAPAPTTSAASDADALAAKATPSKGAAKPDAPGPVEAAATDQTDTAEAAPADDNAKPVNLARLDPGVAVPVDTSAARKTDLSAIKPTPVAAPAQPTVAAQTPPPAEPATTVNGTAAPAPVLAEAAQALAPPPARDAPKDKGSSRYARGEGERSRATASATPGASSSGSAISARMGDVAQSAANAQTPAFTLAAVSGKDTQELAATIAASSEAPEAAAPSADVNAATSNTTAPATINQPATHQVRGQPQTVANLAAQIIKKLDGRSTRFDVALDPMGLGHVDVRLEIGAQGRMTAALAFDTPQAAAELRARSAELQTALEQAGFDISGGLSFDVAGDNGQSQGSAGQDNQPAPVFRGRAFQAALDTVVEPAANRPFQNRRSSASGVDIRI